MTRSLAVLAVVALAAGALAPHLCMCGVCFADDPAPKPACAACGSEDGAQSSDLRGTCCCADEQDTSRDAAVTPPQTQHVQPTIAVLDDTSPAEGPAPAPTRADDALTLPLVPRLLAHTAQLRAPPS